MKVTPTAIPDLLVIEPDCFGDERGYFFESFSARRYAEQAGIHAEFVQDNQSRSARGVLRGLHYQLRRPQGKLVRVVFGEIYDVGVDLRPSSPTYLKWAAVSLSAANRCQLWLPAGFAHGFMVVSDTAEVLYKTTDYYDPEDQNCLVWNDATLAIDWPVQGLTPIVSERDMHANALADAPRFP
jgi:dTDP-4-dehydrorhamnose 3,5-epimerase